MLTLKRIIFVSTFISALLSTAAAQEKPEVQATSLTISAAASGERVRIAAPSSIVQLHVEIYAPTGEKMFDQEIRGGNVFDWHLQDGQGQRLAPGAYVCVVTAKSTSGKLTQKIGAVSVAEKSVSLQPAVSLSVPQAQTIGPMEENSSWTIAGDEPETTTVIAHDGTDGQMIRGRGALSFRIGNFFSGNDTEQMRLTEAGNLGIGTGDPQAKLDVAGTIRAQRFLMARPKSAASEKISTDTLTTDSSDFQPLIAGTGSQNRIAKWTDNAGTLGDSGITETAAGLVGIGTTAPDSKLVVSSNSSTLPPATGMARFAEADGVQTTVFADSFGTNPIFNVRRANGTAASPSALQANQLMGVIGASGYGASAYMGTRARVAFWASENWTNTANGTYLTLNTTANGAATPGGTERVRIDSAGNVGIGTAGPSAKLDVAGDINTSTQYNIAVNRVLTVTGSSSGLSSSNTFVGVNAGLSNSPANSGITPNGNFNSFFGEAAGKNNTLGLGNSYFGNSAGRFIDASNNSFFGYGAGSQAGGSGNAYFGSNAGNSIIGDNNTAVGGGAGGTTFMGNGVTLIGSGTVAPAGNFTNATAIGANATILQSNSLILGNNANVGIGTSSPVARLNVVGSGGSGQGLQFDNREIKFRGEGDAHYSIFANRIAGTLTIEDTSSAFNMNTAGTVLLAITKGSGNVGLGGVTAPTSKLQVNGQGRFSTVNIDSYVAGQTLPLCTASSGGNQNLIGLCNSSSLRYKTNVNLFRSGLNVISRLRPISYDWKESGARDVGLAAEEVEKVEPLLTFRNQKGEIEGVRYDRLGVVFINAIKEQQAEIEQQQRLIQRLQSRLTRLETNRQKRPGHSAARSGMKNKRLK